jgi:hypothetical protein
VVTPQRREKRQRKRKQTKRKPERIEVYSIH